MEKKKLVGSLLLTSFLLSMATLSLNLICVVSGQHEPEYGGVLISSSHDEPATLNPGLTTADATYFCVEDVYSGLLYFDTDLNIYPDLAESWSISDDGLTYTFNLVHNATFHDGVPLTSADVKFSFEEVASQHHPMAKKFFAVVDLVETPDDYTVVFKLQHPFQPIIYAFQMYYFAILPKHLYENTDILTNPHNFDPIGTGPFKFKEYVAGSHVTLEKNENYFRKGKPYLDKIVIKIVTDPKVADLMLETGEIDYVPVYVQGADVERLTLNPDIIVSEAETKSLLKQPTLTFNMRPDHITSDIRVRQAIAYAIDRPLALETIGFGYGILNDAAAPFPPGMEWCYHTQLAEQNIYERDVAEANRILDDAGYTKGPDGVRFHLKGVGGNWYVSYYKNTELIAELLEEIGIVVDCERMDRATYNEKVFKNYEYDLSVVQWTVGVDPSLMIERFVASDQITGIPWTNFACYNNSRVDDLFELARKEQDVEMRKDYFYEIQEIMNEEVPMIPLYQLSHYSAWRKDYRGFPKSPFIGVQSKDSIWWTGAPELGPEVPMTYYVAPIVLSIVALITSTYAVFIARKQKRS